MTRRSLLGAALGLALAACSGGRGPGPLPSAIEPATAVRGESVDVVVTGAQFRPRVLADLDRPGQSVVDLGYAVRVGEAAAVDVVWVDSQTLRATVPGTLAEGVHDVVVTAPGGATGQLLQAFTVTAPPARVIIETRPGGLGREVGDLRLRVGSTDVFFAVVRGLDGGYQRDLPDAEWLVFGAAGTVAPPQGASTTFTATAVGTATVTVHAVGLPDDSTGTITVVPCTENADCRSSCHSQATCDLANAICVPGPADKDTDLDTFIDAACAGGTDCDDGDAQVKPGALEQPYGDPTCNDGRDNDCDGLRDALDDNCLPNAAPIPKLTVNPAAGTPADTFTGSSAGTVDREEPAPGLRYEWDWDADGTFEAAGPTTTHTFAASGFFPVSLKVTDKWGLAALATATVVVAPAADVGVVDIQADENDANATPGAPLGTGFSLREALAWADRTAGVQTVVVPPGTSVRLGSQLDMTSAARTVLVAQGAAIDGAALPGAGSSCLDVAGGPHLIVGLEILNCKGWPLYLHGSGAQVTRAAVHDNTYGVELAGTDNVFGPDNDVWANGSHGVEVAGRGTVIDNTIRNQAAPGIVVRSGGDDARIVGNRIFDTQLGISLLANADRVHVLHNTFHATGADAVAVSASAGFLDVRNNVLSGYATWGLNAGQGSIGTVDANDFFGLTGAGSCRGCTTLGSGSLAVDPKFVDVAARDLRLDLFSPLVDRGVDLGEDRNGAWPGDYLGARPDVGAFEIR